MPKLLIKVQTWRYCEDGATAIEYGLIAAGISVAISAVVFTLGDELANLFGDMSGQIAGASGGE